MNNLKTTDNLLKKVGDAAGNSQDKFDKIYGNSLEAKINKFKHTWEELYQSLISSDALKVIVQTGTKLVGVLDALVNSSKGIKLSLLVLLPTVILLTKNFKFMALEIATGNGKIKLLDIVFGSLFGRLTGGFSILGKIKDSFKSLGVVLLELVTTPAGLIFLGIATAVGVATAAVIKHIKHQKEIREENKKLKKSYEDLTAAMKANNKEAIKNASEDPKKAQDELQGLMKKRGELKKIMESSPNMKDGASVGVANQLKDTEKRIQELRKALKANNFTIDEATGKIVELAKASSHVANLDMANAIKETAEYEIQEKDAIINLYDEYNRLISIKNKNKTQEQELSHVSESLNDKVKGLILTKDKEGNVIIENTGLLGKEIDVLRTEGVTVEQLTKVKLSEANKSAQIQQGLTKITYEEAKKRILILQEEAAKAQPMADILNKQFSHLKITGGNVPQSYIDGLTNQRLDLQKQVDAIDNIYNQAKSTITTDNNTPDFTPTDPEKTKKSTEATKENTGVTNNYIKIIIYFV